MVGTHNAANHQEPYYDPYCVHDLLRVFPHFAVHLDLLEEFPANREVEDGTDTDWPKEADECSLRDEFNLMDVPVHRKYDWHPADQENENTQEDESVERDDVVVEE